MAEIFKMIGGKSACWRHGKGHESWIVCKHIYVGQPEAFSKICMVAGQAWCRECDSLNKEDFADVGNWNLICSECLKDFVGSFVYNYKSGPAHISEADEEHDT